MQRVFVQDVEGKPLMPAHPARARMLLRSKRAVCVKRVPFTIRLEDRSAADSATQPTRVKLDPGSRTTGIALTVQCRRRGWVAVWAANLTHRGHEVKQALTDRRMFRRGRRARKTRHRAPRFDNRTRPAGWLPPSIASRVDNVAAWASRLMRSAPIDGADVETVRFDTQLLQDPDIEGVEYQQGTLYGYELREYLLARHDHTCAYCAGLSDDPVLEREHVVARSRHGSDRVANQVIACKTCNQAKANRTAGEWAQVLRESRSKLDRVRAVNAAAIQRGVRPSLRDAAAVNAARFAVVERLRALGLPVRTWTGGRTKFNRTRLGLAKDHWIDAACVGGTGAAVTIPAGLAPLSVRATGRGDRRVHRNDRHGFPVGRPRHTRRVRGFSTGDLVRLVQPSGRYRGVHAGRLAGIRERGAFDIGTAAGRITAPWHRFGLVQRADGYVYA